MAADTEAVGKAVDQWFVVLNAMINGDPAPFAELYSHAEDVTYMGAEGTYHIGWPATWADWQAQAAKSTGGELEAADVHIVVLGDMATATHRTEGTVTQPDGTSVMTSVRETSVFRNEDGNWRMIGHQADAIPSLVKAFDK